MALDSILNSTFIFSKKTIVEATSLGSSERKNELCAFLKTQVKGGLGL